MHVCLVVGLDISTSCCVQYLYYAFWTFGQDLGVNSLRFCIKSLNILVPDLLYAYKHGVYTSFLLSGGRLHTLWSLIMIVWLNAYLPASHWTILPSKYRTAVISKQNLTIHLKTALVTYMAHLKARAELFGGPGNHDLSYFYKFDIFI